MIVALAVACVVLLWLVASAHYRINLLEARVRELEQLVCLTAMVLQEHDTDAPAPRLSVRSQVSTWRH